MLNIRHTFTLAATLSLLLTACAGGQTSAELTTTTLAPLATLAPATTATSTTIAAPSTTTTVPSLLVYDTVNGLKAPEDVMDRRAVAIKIDNHPNARPQSGLMEADLVYEMLVEGGLTRFAAIFHQTDLDYVGPVRSGRPTDVGVVRALDAPFQVSGAQSWVQDIFTNAGLKMAWDRGIATWRENHRTAPHNLFASTYLLRDLADDRNWSNANPGNVFKFGDPTESSDPATEVIFDWSNHPEVRWLWNGATYERFNGDEPHTWVDKAGNTGQVSTQTIVTIVGTKHMSHSPNGKGTSVPTTETVGSGDAYVFTSGTVIMAAWERVSYEDPIHLTATDGTDLVLAPTRIWIAIFPDDAALTWK